MKSSKKKLIEFLCEKHDIIKKSTGLDYVTVDDIKLLDEIGDLDEIWSIIQAEIKIGTSGLSVQVCPWCISSNLGNMFCSDCLYSQRETICNIGDENYYIIKKELSSSVYKQILRDIEHGM